MSVYADLRAGNSTVIITLREVCSRCLLDLSSKGKIGLLLISEPLGNIQVGLLTCHQLIPGRSTGGNTGCGVVFFRGNGALHLYIANSSSDDSSTIALGGDLTVLIHSGNILVRRCPLDGPAGCLRRHNGRNQGHGVADPQMLTVAVEQDAADGSADLHLGDGTGDKIEAIEPSVAAVL